MHPAECGTWLEQREIVNDFKEEHAVCGNACNVFLRKSGELYNTN